jgi:ClpP class serine protease
MVGSIGTVVEITDISALEESIGIKTYTITSSNAPKKRFDIKTEEGQVIVQAYLDKMASVFVGFVASGREVSPEFVESDFGQGGVVIGIDAIENKMADTLGTFEGLLSSLKKETKVTLDQIQLAISALGDGDKEALMSNLVPSASADEGEITRVGAINSVASVHGDIEGISALMVKAIDEKMSVADFSKTVIDLKASASKAFEDENHSRDLDAEAEAKSGWAIAFKK